MIVVWTRTRSLGFIYEPDHYGLRPKPTVFIRLGYFLLHIIRHRRQS